MISYGIPEGSIKMTEVILDRALNTLKVVSDHSTVYIHDVIGLERIEGKQVGDEELYNIVSTIKDKWHADRIYCRAIDIKEEWRL